MARTVSTPSVNSQFIIKEGNSSILTQTLSSITPDYLSDYGTATANSTTFFKQLLYHKS